MTDFRKNTFSSSLETLFGKVFFENPESSDLITKKMTLTESSFYFTRL